MLLIKKIFKISLIILSIFILVIIIDLSTSKINSVDDISNLVKIKMYDDSGKVFYEINNLHESSYVEIEDISPHLIKTVIGIEDKRFYEHPGFDILRIGKAIINNLTSDTLIGGSTITQQYVKNIYLSSERSIIRKIRELYYAVKLECLYSKQEILEGYLNTIYFNHGVYGIYDAAKYYFNKEPIDLTLAESATLTAIIKSPANYSPITNESKNNERKQIILDTLLKNKDITVNEYNNALSEKVIITKTKYQRYSDSVSFYKDIVLNEIEKTALKSRNFDIYTSFNYDVNDYIDQYIKENPIYSNLGIVILNNSGELVACTSKNYGISNFNITLNTDRMIGSTIKPMLYYMALNNGMSAISKFTSEPTTFYINHTPYNFQNYNQKYENNKITMAYALATSDNIYAVKTHLYIGSDKLISFLKKFNVDVKDNYPSLALGAAEMSLLKLTSIYNTFSRLGEYSDPKTIRYIDSNGTRYMIKVSKDKQLLLSSNSYIINDLLTYTFDTNLGGKINVTGASISNRLITKVSAKSGLTDFDSYIIGYTPLYTVGIWTGNNDYSLLTDTYSKNFPKEAFLHIINFLSKENKNIWYEKPNDIYAIFTSPTGFSNQYLKNVYFKR